MAEITTSEVHHYHHSDNDGIRVTVKVEKNSKGYNWEASGSGAKSVAEAIFALSQAEIELRKIYGEPVKEGG